MQKWSSRSESNLLLYQLGYRAEWYFSRAYIRFFNYLLEFSFRFDKIYPHFYSLWLKVLKLTNCISQQYWKIVSKPISYYIFKSVLFPRYIYPKTISHYCRLMKNLIMPVATHYISCYLAILDPQYLSVCCVCAQLFVASHLFFSEGHARGHYTLPRTCFECSSVLSPVAAAISQCCPGSDSRQQQLHETAVKPIFPPILLVVIPAGALCLQLNKNLCLNFPNLAD